MIQPTTRDLSTGARDIDGHGAAKSGRERSVYVALSADPIQLGHLNINKVAGVHGEVTVGLLTDVVVASYKVEAPC